jgi:radical SAM superfamily enzyme YgiQ (UPF0313 family)
MLPFHFPTLSLTTVAALSPPAARVAVIDENVETIPRDNTHDLVGITVMTPLAPRAYELARAFRRRGTPVVLGGHHVTALPDEAAAHADAVVVGEAERVWPQVVADAAAGRLRPRYRADEWADMAAVPRPRRDLLDRKKYLFRNTIQLTRGCPFDCEFCSVTSFFGRTYRTRQLEQVIPELKAMRQDSAFAFFVDDNLFGAPRYARALFRELKPLRFKWVSHASITIAYDEAILAEAAAAGCRGLFLGFESLDRRAISAMGKRFNDTRFYEEGIRRLHDHGIGVLGSFVLGTDHDTPATFDRIRRFVDRTRLDGLFLPILTPFPGTRLWRRLHHEGRIVTEDWSRYDMEHVTFRPGRMTVADLERGFERVNGHSWSWPSLLTRLLKPRNELPFFRPNRSIQIFGPMNVGYNTAWRRWKRTRRQALHTRS